MARSKKRAAPTAASSRPAKKRKSAEASLAKMKEITEAEDAFSEDEKEEAKALAMVANAPEEDAESVVSTDGLQDHALITGEALPLVAPGFRLWETESKLASKGGLTQVSKYDEVRGAYSHILKVNNDEEFTLMPLTVTAGPYKGRRIFMLEPTTGFRFFDFPPEIRNHVYSFLVEADKRKIRISTSKRVHEARRPVIGGEKYDPAKKTWIRRSPLFSVLLRTNKQIFREAAPILYGTNQFRFAGFGTLKIFVERIGSMRQYLRSIHLDSMGFQRTKVRTSLNLLKDATDLRTLTFDHENLCLDTPPYYYNTVSLNTFIYFLRPFLKALHRSSEQSSRATNVLEVIKIAWKRCKKCKAAAPNFPPDNECRQTGFANRPAHFINTTRCVVLCKDLEAHCGEIEKKARGLFAKELGITVPEESSREASSEL